METPTLLFKVHSHCGLEKAGEVVSEKGFGIAMPNGAEYR